MSTLYLHYVYIMSTLCLHYVYTMSTLCLHYVHTMSALCLHYVCTMSALCLHYVYINIFRVWPALSTVGFVPLACLYKPPRVFHYCIRCLLWFANNIVQSRVIRVLFYPRYLQQALGVGCGERGIIFAWFHRHLRKFTIVNICILFFELLHIDWTALSHLYNSNDNWHLI